MTHHVHELPTTPEEFMEAWASTFESSELVCSHCSGPLTAALSITSALRLRGMPTSLARTLHVVRRDFGPWAVVALCSPCGDVACWPVTEQMRREIFDAIMAEVS